MRCRIPNARLILGCLLAVSTPLDFGARADATSARPDAPAAPPDTIELDKWFQFSDQPNGFLHPQAMFFDGAGAHTASMWVNSEALARPTRVFLDAYRNNASLKHGVDLPLGMTAKIGEDGRRVPVSANGYVNDPPFPEFDYHALIRDLFDRFLNTGRSPRDLAGVYLMVDIEHGFTGYRPSRTAPSGSIPGVFRSGSFYYDQKDPESPLNCSRAAFREGQRLQLQMCKLAELIRRESIRRFGSAPVIGWYNMLPIPARIRINEEGKVDGSGRTPPNTHWRELSPEQKEVILDRVVVNCRPLLEGGVLPDDGLRYRGLDSIQLNALQDLPLTTKGARDNRNQRMIDLGRRLKVEREAGAIIPPVVVSSCWTFTDKQNSPDEGQFLPEEQVRYVLVDGYRDLDISGYFMCQFKWERFISNCFNLSRPDWSELSPLNREMAEDAWRLIWTPLSLKVGTSGLPGYRPTAQETIGNGGFSDVVSIRDTWLRTLASFLEDRFGKPMGRSCTGPRIVP